MNDDFVISAHALTRFEERFPTLYQNDQQVAKMIHDECMDALKSGRSSHVAPLELAHYDPALWKGGEGLIVWVRPKTRGYVLVDTDEGTVVATVLKGRDVQEVKRRHHGR